MKGGQMSFEAMAWASKQTAYNSVTKLVLMMLANYSDDEHSTWPSYAHLATLCQCTERTVMRSIKSLEADGLLKVQPRYTDGGKQTSNRFILSVGGDIKDTPRGDKNDREGVTKTTPYTVRNIQIEKKQTKKAPPYPPEFDQWWATYPRRDGSKAKAFESWSKATNRSLTVDELQHATNRFAVQCRNKDKKFIPHAATWLNQARWETVEETDKQTTNKNTLAG